MMRKISKSEIAKRLELSMPTIAQNLWGLFDKNLIYVDGTFDSTGGRKAAGRLRLMQGQDIR